MRGACLSPEGRVYINIQPDMCSEQKPQKVIYNAYTPGLRGSFFNSSSKLNINISSHASIIPILAKNTTRDFYLVQNKSGVCQQLQTPQRKGNIWYQPFTLPLVRPATKNFWQQINTISMGKRLNTDNAKT